MDCRLSVRALGKSNEALTREAGVSQTTSRMVTGHDEAGKSIVLSDGPPPQHHQMKGAAVGADFFGIWDDSATVRLRRGVEPHEPNEKDFTIMPVSGHLIRIIDVLPPQLGGKRTVMHRTKSIDY